ncbi:MAG TPA: cupin domain-containing protein [Acidimicrobiales bacterium]|jgi:hypothetical protein
MAGLESQNFKDADETRTFDKGQLEVVTLGTATVGRGTFEPGWKWSECIKPIVGTDSCQAAHLGYVVSGQMHVVMDDGSETDAGPGDLFNVAPGHDAWIVGDETCVVLDFEGASNYAKP